MSLNKKQVNATVNYWLTTAEHSYKTMLGLYRIKRYADVLFYGHIVLEKTLKALVVAKKSNNAPKIHDLTELAKLSDLNLEKEEMEFLKLVNRFNIRTRYPDARFNFYKATNQKYTQEKLVKIKKIYKKLCQEIV